MVTTRSCEQGRHQACGGLTATPLFDAVLVHACACLCHAGSATDDALERLLEQEGRHRGTQ